MSFNKWFLFFAAYTIGQVIGWVGESDTSFGITNTDVNDAVGFQIDQESSGQGFLGLLRNVIDFFRLVVPKLVFFNFSFFQGNLEILQWGIVFIFGGTFIAMTVGQRVLGGR